MLYTYTTQTQNVFSIAANDAGYTIAYNGATIGTSNTLTGAHLVIISQMMRLYCK